MFAKGVDSPSNINCNVVGIDWTADIGRVRAEIGDQKAIQGNMDPCVLFGPKEKIREEVERILASYGSGNGHIFNLGHGILPTTPPENTRYLVDCVHELSIKYHQ